MLWQKVERNILKAVRRVVYGNRLPKKNLDFISGEALNSLIYDSLLSDKPFMVARFGSIELSASVYPYLLKRPLADRCGMYIRGEIDFIRKSADYENKLMCPLCNNAGFFPPDSSLLERYSNLMVEDVKMLDCCCCSEWIREDLYDDLYSDDIHFALLNEMEPYDYVEPWSRAFRGKRVLVIHPFADSIRAQYSNREKIWENRDVLPDFTLLTIKAVQSVAGEDIPYDSWFDALDRMKRQMDSLDYDIAVIGCGAYGFHLAAHAKRNGKKAVHLGGATQILFGIKGKRWDDLPEVNKYYNDYWVRPLPEEVPGQCKNVENGCYW